MRSVALLIALVLGSSAARADDSKLAKEDVPLQPRAPLLGKNKLCCGYPISEPLGFALRFYWLVLEKDYDMPGAASTAPRSGRRKKVPENTWVELYTPAGFFMQHVRETFAWALRLEGTALMEDGRVINYTGKCPYGYGTCFEELDTHAHPFGRGAGMRPLIPFKSVAIDPKLVPIGEPLYIPEFDGLVLPDGSIHDGCVRADDTGGGIKRKKMDFFVVTYSNFRFLLDELQNVTWISPQIEAPRCEYLRDRP